jgi:O-antigen/teichoic acid export membrane protein
MSEPARPPRMTRTRPPPVSLMRSLGSFIPSYALALVGYLALSVVAARVLGRDDFGYFVILLTGTSLVGQFSLLGVHRSGLREAAKADDPQQLDELRRGVRAVILVPLPIASVLTVAVLLALRDSSQQHVATALLSGALVYLGGYQKLCANFLRGLGHVHVASMLTGRSGGAAVAIVQALLVLLVAAVLPESGLAGVMAGVTLGFVPPVIWAWWLLERSWPTVRRHGGTLEALRAVTRRDWKFTVSQTGGFLNSTVELWIAGALLPGAATSLFAAAQRLARLLVVPTTSLQVVFSPALARLSEQRSGQLEPLVRTAASVSSVASGVLWLPMALAPALALTVVYGPEFAAAAPALGLLACGYLLNSVTGMSGTALSMSHHEGDLALITWGAIGARVVLGALAAHWWGVTGLAASSVVVATMFYAVTWWAVRQRLGISTHATWRPSLMLLVRIPG